MICRLAWAVCAVAGAAGAQSSRTGLLAVVNQNEHAVVLVDLSTRRVAATIPVGVNGHEVAASVDGTRLYVPIYGDSGVGRPGTDGRTIDVIDVAGGKVEATIDLGRPLRPHKDVFGPDGLLYCTGELGDAIQIVDVKSRAVVGQIATSAKETHMLVLSADGRRGYTANVGAGSVSVLDIPARKLLKVIPLAKTVQRIAISNDGRWVFTSDRDQNRFAVIDTKTDSLSRWVATHATPYVTQATEDGRYLLVSETKGATGGLLEVFDLAAWTMVKSFPLPGAGAGGFLLHGGLVYLSIPGAGVVEVLDPKTWAMAAPIVLTPGVDGLAWAR